MSEDQDKLVNRIKQQLDQQSEELDGETLSRLRQARARALEAGERKGFNWLGLPGGAVALASVAVLAVVLRLALPTATTVEMAQVTDPGPNHAQVLDDLELLAAAEDLEFYEEIEFYYWLETQDAQG